MKQTNFRMPDELAAFYEKNYSSLSAGALYAAQQMAQAAEIIGGTGEELISRLQELEAITKIATREVTGMFTRQELIAMIDALNGTLINREILFVPGWLVIEMQDAEALDGTCSRHGADAGELIAKLDTLNHTQAYALYNLIRGFWMSDDQSRDLDRFVDQYAKK